MSDATLVSATLAGAFASIVESSVTYPLEYLKVREQIALRPLHFALPSKHEIPRLTSVFYSGLSPFVAGNAIKTGVRFNLFNAATKFMSEGTGGQVSAPIVVVSGAMAGIAETMIIVPFESIKTSMIEASSLGAGAAKGALPPPGAPGTAAAGTEVRRPAPAAAPLANESRPKTKPRSVRPVVGPANLANSTLHEVRPLHGLFDTVRHMYQQRGLRAFVQGFSPTVWRQVAVSSIRFTTFNFWTQLFTLEGEESLSLYKVVSGAAVAAAAEVALTQPLDVVKSRMQTANGIKLYGNSLLCAYRVFTEEGWKRLWSGSFPRWMRMWLSGGIMWAAYEASFSRINRQMQERPFQ